MVDFRKILGLAGAATLFAGMAFGQVTTASCVAAAGALQPTSITFISAEGQNELISNLVLSCNNTAATGGLLNVTVYFSPTVTITSPPLTGVSTGQTTMSAFVGTPVPQNAANPVGTPVAISGTINAGSAVFSSIPVPAAIGPFTVTLANIRVNATAIPITAGAAPTALNAQAFVSGTNVTPGSTGAAIPVAYVTNGLQTSKLFSDAAGNNQNKFSTSNVAATGLGGNNASTFGVCGSLNNTGGVSAQPNFFIQVLEGFQSAFKAQADVPSGFLPESITPISSYVISGTRVKVTFANVPAGLSIYMPLRVNSSNVTAPVAQLSAVLSETAGTNAVNLQTAVTTPSQFTLGTFTPAVGGGTNTAGGVFQVAVANNVGTAIYEVTTSNLNVNDAYMIPVYYRAGTNAIASGATALTVTTSLAPIGSTSQIPSYQALASSTATATITTFTQCTTTLLFPFVTNQNGFETGISIANTTGDPFGSVSAQTGGCKLWFYNTSSSSGPSPTAGPAPDGNGGTAPVAASSTVAFTVTMALATASAANPATFAGYMLAQCQFTNAHGFAYITYAFPGTSSNTMGYLALVTGRGSSAGFEALAQ